MNRQVLVQRLLLPGGSNQSYDLVDVKHLQNKVSHMKEEEKRKMCVAANKTTATTVLTPDITDDDCRMEDIARFKAIRNSGDMETSSSVNATTSSLFFNNIQIDGIHTPPTTASSSSSASIHQQDNSMPSSSMPDSDFDECSSKLTKNN